MDRKLGWIDGRALLVGLFVAVGCGPTDEELEADFLEQESDLWCQMLMACDPALEAEACGEFVPDPCTGFDASKADECLDRMEASLDELLADPGTCEELQRPEACFFARPSTPDADGCEGVPGRPIREHGQMVLAAVGGGGPITNDDRGYASTQWLEAAQMEHASIAAFGRLSTELLAVGAPLELVRGAHEAAVDEARHTELCLARARSLGRPSWSLGRLRVVPARPDITLETLAVEALLEGCIGEGIAAAHAAVARRHADPDIAEEMRVIARDELNHAQLAWRVLGWTLSQDPSLAAPVRAAFDQWQESAKAHTPDASRAGVPALGVLSAAERHLVARTFVHDVTGPALDAVLREHRRRAA